MVSGISLVSVQQFEENATSKFCLQLISCKTGHQISQFLMQHVASFHAPCKRALTAVRAHTSAVNIAAAVYQFRV